MRPHMRKPIWIVGLTLPALLLLRPALSAAQPIQAMRIAGSGSIMDPAATFWESAPAVTVATIPQTITAPTKVDPAVKSLSVQAVHNGEWMAFRLQWEDPTKSDVMVVDRFADQVAIELPNRFKEDALPSPMMGNPGARVSVMQWRAAFQRDLDEGERTVRDIYPYALVDVYPDQVLNAIDARPYTGAIGVDNPVSQVRKSPVLDQMAEGWGTMTVKREQHADGRGIWADGRWRVLITHPLRSGSDNDPDLSPGGKTVAAFAVWDGGAQEVGSRKAWTPWVPVTLAE